MSRVLGNVALFIAGAIGGLVVWWVIWGPMVAVGLLPAAWHWEGDNLVVDDALSALGAAVGLVLLPIGFGVSVVKTVRDG